MNWNWLDFVFPLGAFTRQHTFEEPKQAIRNMRIIHYALCMGAFMFAMVTLLLHDFNPGPLFDRGYDGTQDVNWYWFLVVCGVAVLGMALSIVIFGVLMRRLDKSAKPMELLNKFHVANIVRLALLDGPILFCIVSFFLGFGSVYLLIGFALWLYMISLHPTNDRVARELGIKP